MVKIAMVTPWFPTDLSPSSGQFVWKDCLALSRVVEELRIIHLVPPHEDDQIRKTIKNNLKILRIPMQTNNPWSIVQASRHLKQAIDWADIVHTQAISAIEPFVLNKPNKPWIHTEHWSAITTPSSLNIKEQYLLPFLLKMEKYPDLVIAVCDFLAKPLRKVRGNRPVGIIPCQVPSPFCLSPRRKRKQNSLKLISTGALVPRKDPLLALDALLVLRKKGIDASLTWLGEGPLRKECEEKAKLLDLPAFFPGTTDMAGVQSGLADSDMFFGPTRADNFFVAAAEAIVNGRPLVVGATGGHGEYISSKVGRLVVNQSAEEYAQAIMELDQHTFELSAEDIAQTVGNRFSPETIAHNYLNCYKNLLSANQR